MGGNALKTVVTRRYRRDEFFAAWSRFEQAFTERFPGVRVALVKAYAAKDSFGDMDVVIEGDRMPDNWPLMVDELFDVRDSSMCLNKQSLAKVNEVGYTAKMLMQVPYSFHLNDLQVDLCPVPSEEFDFTVEYLSYNDLGNLMGKVYRRLGVRYAMAGLQVVPTDAQGRLMPHHPVTLTRDHAEALRFAGYDPLRFAQGFETLEDVYEYASSSPFFNPAFFLELRVQNNEERQRVRRRHNYRGFLSWVETHRGRLHQGPIMALEDARERTLQLYPWARAACEQAVQAEAGTRRQKKRFNGELLREITGVNGPQLGLIAEFMTSEFDGSQSFLVWLATQSDTQLRDWAKARYEQYLILHQEPGA